MKRLLTRLALLFSLPICPYCTRSLYLIARSRPRFRHLAMCPYACFLLGTPPSWQ